MSELTQDQEAICALTKRVAELEARLERSEQAKVIAELVKDKADLVNQIRQIHKDYGCEIRDPCGTIWEHASKCQDRIAELEELLEHKQDLYNIAIATGEKSEAENDVLRAQLQEANLQRVELESTVESAKLERDIAWKQLAIIQDESGK